MRKAVALAGALAALAAGATGTPADAGKTAPSAETISVSRVYLDDGRPMVAGTYRCTGRLSHLWVSVKQGAGDLTQEGSGAESRSWYQRTWDNKINCDGKRHTRVFALDPTGDTGRVRAGNRAYVQFCLLTANRPKGFEEGGNSSFDSIQRYRTVRNL